MAQIVTLPMAKANKLANRAIRLSRVIERIIDRPPAARDSWDD